MEFRRGFKAEANRVALRVRAQMGLSPIAPIDPAAICDHFDIKLLRLSDIDRRSAFLGTNNSSFSAVTVPCGFHTAIVHNDSHHPHRQRSNICHELAHCFLGHKCTPPLMDNGERAHDGGIEAEAHHLAGVLIPNEAARHIVSNGLVTQAPGIYGVSSAMLTYRLRISGAHKIHQRRMQSSAAPKVTVAKQDSAYYPGVSLAQIPRGGHGAVRNSVCSPMLFAVS